MSAPSTDKLTDPSHLPILRDRNFQWLWLAQIISALGDWALLVAIPITVYTATNSKVDVSVSVICGTLPVILFSLIGGVLADRWNRRRLMIASDLGRALAVVFLLGVHNTHHFGRGDLALFYFVSFLVASFSCFFSPARTALMRELLPPEKMLELNGLILTGVQMTMLVGPPLGSLLAAGNPKNAFLFDSLTFVASAVCAAFVADGSHFAALKRAGAARARGAGALLREAWMGIHFVGTSPALRGLLCLLAAAVVGGYIYNTLEFPFIRDELGGSGRSFGFLVSLGGVASLLTALVASGPARSLQPPRLLLLGFSVMAAAGWGFAYSKNLYLGGVALFGVGVGNTLVNLALATLFQTMAPNEMQGRVSGTINLINRLSMALGASLAAALVGAFPASASLPPIYAGVAGIFLLCGLLARPLISQKSPQDAPPVGIISAKS